jgi:hypothetical protein
MRRISLAVLVLSGGVASADPFTGFSGMETGYQVGKDRLCSPLPVDAGVAKGTPSCEKATDDQIAQASIKTAKPVRGAHASHTAAAKGRTLTITAVDADKVAVTWDAPDPIEKVENVYVSAYMNLIAVEYTVRRGSRDVTDVVGFDLRGSSPATQPDHPVPTTQPSTTTEPPAATPAFTKALKAARKAAKGSAKSAAKAWQKVLAIDPDASEARYGMAAALVKSKKKDDALTELEALAASTRADAIEWLIQARFDKAFASVRAETRFRAATGLDKPYGTFYERLMGHGGTWEQAGTSCDAPTIDLTFKQDRTYRLAVKSVCNGERYEDSFKGDWQPKEPSVTMVLHNRDKPDETFDCTIEREGDEDSIHCDVDQDLSFVARPVRR